MAILFNKTVSGSENFIVCKLQNFIKQPEYLFLFPEFTDPEYLKEKHETRYFFTLIGDLTKYAVIKFSVN